MNHMYPENKVMRMSRAGLCQRLSLHLVFYTIVLSVERILPSPIKKNSDGREFCLVYPSDL